MKQKKWYRMYVYTLLFLFLTVASAAIIGSCGGGGGGGDDGGGGETTSRTSTYLGTQSPGDVWRWTITMINGSGICDAINETTGYTYSCRVTTLPNKFLKLTITATTDPNITTLPAYAYALEFPDTALIVKPVGADSKVIVGVAQGACPTSNATYNWVTMPWTGWNNAVDNAYGVTALTVSGSNLDFSHNYYLLSGAPATPPTGTATGFTCSGGRITKAGNSMVIGVTPSGLAIGDSGPNMGGFVGMAAPAANVNLNDVVLAGREYRGVYFENNSAVDDTNPVWARPNGSGGFAGGEYLDFEGNVEDTTDPVTVAFNTQANPGIVNGTLTDSSGSRNIVMMINRINGKYFIYGINARSVPGEPGNFFVIER